VRKEDYAKRDYFDLWFPALAPSAKWVSWALAEPFTDARWVKYAKNYRREMAAPEARRVLQLLALLSQQTDFSVGCYCADEARCHRRLLCEVLIEHGAKMKGL